MTASRIPSIGSVVWTEFADPNGHRKVRPAVVVSIKPNDKGEQLARLVAVTTQIPEPLPSDYVLLPWSAQGKVRTSLRKKSAAVTAWVESLPLEDIDRVVGTLPPAILIEILTKIEPLPD